MGTIGNISVEYCRRNFIYRQRAGALKIALVYILPVANPKLYLPMARRFVEKYIEFVPGTTDHELFVCINGGTGLHSQLRELFYPLVPSFLYHDNSGYDIGAYMMAAKSIRCDTLVCIGTPVRPAMAGWLDIMIRAVEENGPGLFGLWGFRVPDIHIRTTFFWTQPEILNSYPYEISTGNRYRFEFGKDSITRYCLKIGLPVLQITKCGVFDADNFHHVEQEDCYMRDQHTARLGWKD